MINTQTIAQIYQYTLILIQLLKKVKDCRCSQGKRHPLWLLLLLVILGRLMGYMGYPYLAKQKDDFSLNPEK